MPWKDKYEKSKKPAGAGHGPGPGHGAVGRQCSQSALWSVGKGPSHGLRWLGAQACTCLNRDSAVCALIVMRANSGPAVFSRLLCPLPHCPSQPFSSVLFSFSVDLHWSGVSRPVKYINEFLAPALCTQVTHCTPWSFAAGVSSAWSCQLTAPQTLRCLLCVRL